MVCYRRLQRQNEKGVWYNDSYAIEMPTGLIEFRYNLTWERIGGRYAVEIRDSGLPLEEIHQILNAPGLKWLPVERLDMSYDQATEFLDPQFYIPRLKKKVPAQAG